MSVIEPWEREQRERNTRALDHEMHTDRVDGLNRALQAMTRERDEARRQLVGAVSALEKMVAVADLEATGDDTISATWVAAEARKVLARLVEPS